MMKRPDSFRSLSFFFGPSSRPFTIPPDTDLVTPGMPLIHGMPIHEHSCSHDAAQAARPVPRDAVANHCAQLEFMTDNHAPEPHKRTTAMKLQRRSSSRTSRTTNARRSAPRRLSTLELLEARTMLSATTVMNGNDSGPGSLRDAVASGSDTITF